MGNSAAKQAGSATCETGSIKPAQALSGVVTKEAKKMKCSSTSSVSTFVNDNNEVALTAKSTKTSMMPPTKLDCTMMDGSGSELCTSSFKDGMTSATFDVSKAGTIFATGEIKKGMGSATCTYKVGEDVVYVAKKFKTMKFFMALYEQDASGRQTMVAKASQPGMDVKKVDFEIGVGVDEVALAIITGFVGAASGSSGAAAGGLAGAGVY